MIGGEPCIVNVGVFELAAGLGANTLQLLGCEGAGAKPRVVQRWFQTRSLGSTAKGSQALPLCFPCIL